MTNDWLSAYLHWLGGEPCFRIHGKARCERDWRVLSVYATSRRDAASRWPLWRGTCITWTSDVIVVGWDFARELLREQARTPVFPHCPLEVAGGRVCDPARRASAGAREIASHGEIMAHECGHSWQALRLGPAYLPFVGPVTLFREGPRAWNHFENQASALGQFGGIVAGSICAALSDRI